MLENNSTLSGVNCTVSECHYHTKDDRCSAESIMVNGNSATTSRETECETFKPHCCD